MPGFVFIINPISGRSRKKRIGKMIAEVFSPEEIVVFYTLRPGHAYEIAREYAEKNIHCCVAVGGDGTVNEVASALIGSQTALGIIPAGSGNGLANSLRIPRGRKRAMSLLRQNTVHSIDAGKINNHYFFSNCGIGFDARVGHEFAIRNKRGIMGYVRSAIRQFVRYKPSIYRIEIDGQGQDMKAFLIAVANSGQYGGHVYISPKSRLDDGLLDVCIVKPFPMVAVVPLGVRLLRKRIDRSHFLEVIRGRTITLEGARKQQRVHIDGEPKKISGLITIEILPAALKVIAPVI